MNIEDLSRRLLVWISIEIERGNNDPYIRDLAMGASISESHTKRLLKTLKSNGLIERERHYRRCTNYLTDTGEMEAKELREYFRLS